MSQPVTDPAADLESALQEAIGLHRSGRLAEAETIYRKLLRAAPRHAETLSMLGVLAAQCGDLRRGRELVKAAIAEGPDHAGHRFNLAHILHMAGDPTAGHVYREALDRDPNHLPALVNFGNLLLATDRLDEAANCFESAVRVDPQALVALEGLGITRQRQHRVTEAIAAFERVVALDPDNANAQSNLGGLLLEAGRRDDAIVAIRAALERLPGRADLHTNLGVALASGGLHAEALAEFDRALQLAPGYTRALGMKGLTLIESGDHAAAAAILNYDRLLVSTRLTSVPGYADLAAFNAALAHAVRHHPTLLMDRPSKTTRIGAQTGELLDGPGSTKGGSATGGGPLAVLCEVIRQAVATYFRLMQEAPDRPFPAPIPARWRLAVWGTVLNEGGHQDPHNHPAGVLSGVYYVQLPRVTDGGAEGRGAGQGAIEFGAPPAQLAFEAEPLLRLLPPQEGLLLMFPSYFWHRTIPASGDRQRISIAFDVVPED